MEKKKKTTPQEINSLESYNKLLENLGLSTEDAKNLCSEPPPPIAPPQPAVKQNSIDSVALLLFKKYFPNKSKVYFCRLIPSK